jgi:hypothetical protein
MRRHRFGFTDAPNCSRVRFLRLQRMGTYDFLHISQLEAHRGSHETLSLQTTHNECIVSSNVGALSQGW